MSHFTLGVVNVGGGECRGGECRGGECRTILFLLKKTLLSFASLFYCYEYFQRFHFQR